MRLTHSAWLLLLTVAFAAGCSSSEVAEVDEKSDLLTGALASTMPLITEFESLEDATEDSGEPVTPFDENLNFFTPPKMIIPIEAEEQEEELGGDLPPLRLVGFVGDKAMVDVKGKMHIVTPGKRLNGFEIVSVESPNVELRWGETALTLNFYKPGKTTHKPAYTPSPAFSSKLSNFGSPPKDRGASKATPQSAPAPPRPHTSLPPLPGLPSPGNSTGAGLSEFPDLGSGPGAAPKL